MEKPSNLELACQVFWGTTVDPDECNLSGGFKDPETMLMEKESAVTKYNQLSSEAKEVVQTILTLPDNFFHNGVIMRESLYSFLQAKHGWSKYFVKRYITEIGTIFGVTYGR